MSTALYRRYRPETFADVIGQDHVTGPLTAALDNQRVTHAYLFSGPRGCGKTTSARIFARCLNCAEGPTSTPCGTCPSCVDLARGGGGSIDVVEMDAASHGGVDDARELRDRAIFGTARDRYKIFIIDEAHMVTTQGFNALLKLVEEPPPHVKFVFATTEPEKVIGTIRSRTHHYPFRLVPPEQLTAYLESLATAEGVQIDSGVLPLVVRAGGGSVRDSLSVLDQLIAGMDQSTIDYERAVALLGFTHATLLDDTVDALAARDGASLFRVVDRVIDSGHAPRRFVEDLLERLRDLIVVRAAGDQAGSVLRAVPADQLERMRTQATHLGADTLSRSADLVNDALTEMTGATSPRLQLELLCARLLLPGADDATGGYGARLERLESAVDSGAPVAQPAATPVANQPAPTPVAPRPAARPQPAESSGSVAPSPTTEGVERQGSEGETRAATSSAAKAAPSSEAPGSEAPTAGQTAPTRQTAGNAPPAEGAAARRHPSPERPSGESPAATQPAGTAPAAPPAAAGELTADHVRRRWPEVLATLTSIKRTTWALISEHAQVVSLDASSLQLGFSTGGLASAFSKGGHSEHVQRALAETLGLQVRVEPVVSDAASPPAPRASVPAEPSRPRGTSWEPAAESPAPSVPPHGPGESPSPEQSPAAASAEEPPPAETGQSPAQPNAAGEAGTPAQRHTGIDPADSAPAEDEPAAPEKTPGGQEPTAVSQARTGQPEPAEPAPTDGEPAEVPSSGAPPTDDTTAAPPTDGTTDDPPAPAGPPPPWDVAQPAGDVDEAPTSAGSSGPPAAGEPAQEPEIDVAWPSTDWAGRIDPPEQGAAEHGLSEQGPPAEDPPEQGPSAEARAAEESGVAAPPTEQSSTAMPPSTSPRERAMAAAREARRTELSHRSPSAPSPQQDDGDYEPPDPDDPNIESTGLIGAPLVARMLGGTVIDEILDSPEGGDR